MRSTGKMNKITYYGSEKDIAKAIEILRKQKDLEKMRERKARLIIQNLIDKHNLRAVILINGNQVWSKKRILRNLKRIMKHGTLYNPDQKKPPILSRYFYEFLHLECGSIAHYDIWGWIHKYPTIQHLRNFFKKNEFGQRVRDWVPKRFSDVHLIVGDIEKSLFPFQSYMEARKK